jgi:hypothetical protein
VAPSPDVGPRGFWIEELVAECDAGEGLAVSPLPLGADWRQTERGVYIYSPVSVACLIGGSGEDLTFEWTATVGEIHGGGDSIVWTAPPHGAKAQVTVTVRDSVGRAESATLNFRVATCDCVFERY